MAAFFWYASFPNSRLHPRPSTSQAETYQVTIADYTQPITKIVEADENRTYVLVKNLDLATNMWYVYAEESLINPSLVATFGVEFQLILYTPGNQLYEKQDAGTTTNWTAVDIQDVGERIEPLQTASLESPQAIFAASDSAIPVVPDVIVGIDKGSG